MTTKILKLLQNVCWTIAAVGMFFLLLDNTKNDPLTATIFIFTIAGIVFSLVEDKKNKK